MTVFGEVRAWTRALIPEMIKKGYSATRYYNEAVKAGTFYRKQTFLADWREFSGLMKKEKAVRSTPGYAKPKKGVMVEVPFRKEQKYRVFADAKIGKVGEGVSETRVVSFYTDELNTLDEWKQDYQDWVMRNKYKPDEYIDSLDIRAIEHNAGKDY